MKKHKLLLIILATAFAFSSCQSRTTENAQVIFPTTLKVSPTLNPSPTPEPNSDSPIRKIDFENFTYPWTEGLAGDTKNFTLKNGELPSDKDTIGMAFYKVEYADLTGDNQEESIVILGVHTGGSAMPNVIYIYSLRNEKPNLLWSFDTGDRAECGFKRAYAENGELIIELFGDDKFDNGEWKYDIADGKFNGLCCPTTFTKFRFKWNGKKFEQDGETELFDYDWRKPK